MWPSVHLRKRGWTPPPKTSVCRLSSRLLNTSFLSYSQSSKHSPWRGTSGGRYIPTLLVLSVWWLPQVSWNEFERNNMTTSVTYFREYFLSYQFEAQHTMVCVSQRLICQHSDVFLEGRYILPNYMQPSLSVTQVLHFGRRYEASDV